MRKIPAIILSKCSVRDSHIIWDGPVVTYDNPRMSYNGERVLVRRVLAELWLGDKVGNFQLRPTCGEKRCLEPTHLDTTVLNRRTPIQRCKEKKATYAYARDGNLFRNYGITLPEWESLFSSQGRVCAICGTDKPRGKNWHTDHDHSTGRVRGILCGWCNTGIGKLQESPNVMMRALEYLRND